MKQFSLFISNRNPKFLIKFDDLQIFVLGLDVVVPLVSDTYDTDNPSVGRTMYVIVRCIYLLYIRPTILTSGIGTGQAYFILKHVHGTSSCK